MKNIAIYLILLSLIGCTGMAGNYVSTIEKNAKLDSLIKLYCTQKIESRDSLYIVYTAKYWRNMKIGFHYWRNFSELYWINNNDIKPYVSAVFYSKDKKKMVFWLGEKMPNAFTRKHYRPDRDTTRDCLGLPGWNAYFAITPMIGFRDSINRPWTISILPGISTGGESKEMCDRAMAQFCFIDFKNLENHYVTQGGVHKGVIIWKKNGYNVQDTDFFEKCPLWEKDTVGADGLYPFQEHTAKEQWRDYDGGEPCIKCYMDLDYPKIDYPKEILDMYKKN